MNLGSIEEERVERVEVWVVIVVVKFVMPERRLERIVEGVRVEVGGGEGGGREVDGGGEGGTTEGGEGGGTEDGTVDKSTGGRFLA